LVGLAAIPNTNSRDIRKPEKHRVMSERLASEARKKKGAQLAREQGKVWLNATVPAASLPYFGFGVVGALLPKLAAAKHPGYNPMVMERKPPPYTH
jgi:hypothetical protein